MFPLAKQSTTMYCSSGCLARPCCEANIGQLLLGKEGTCSHIPYSQAFLRRPTMQMLRLCHCPSGENSARGTIRSTMHTLPPFSSAPNPCATPGMAASWAAGFGGPASAICSGCPSSSRLSSVPSAGPSLSCAAAACARAICASKISRCLSSSSYVGHGKEAASQDVTH